MRTKADDREGYVPSDISVLASTLAQVSLQKAAASETAAQALFIALRWPTGVIYCPWDRMPITERQARPHISRGKRFYCSACDRPFTSTTKTAIHGTKIPLHKWVKAAALFAACGETISLTQMEHDLALSRRTCWMIRNKIRALDHDGTVVDILHRLIRAEPLSKPCVIGKGAPVTSSRIMPKVLFTETTHS